MKKLLLGIVSLSFCIIIHAQSALKDTTFLQPIEVSAIRANDKMPVAKTNLSKQAISEVNTGQDLPFILNQTPAAVANSDAGNGIGYTGIRIRGTDASRINITLNGIPYNDAESQGTFLVNIPDIASSANSIQVQRGVGTSTNGSGSFGGSINLSTNDLITKRNFEFNNTAGSYGSFKNTLLFNSGIFGKHFTFDGRLSDIRSDGYVDRAASRLQSFFTSIAYADQKQSLRLNVFSGKEKTYQSWYGIDANMLHTNRRFNSAGTEKPGEPYSNETDNYKQTHYQLFYNYKFSGHWKANIAGFYTKGKGYYEEYRADQSLSDYGLPDYIHGADTVSTTDLVRRLWLNNDFYGTIFSFQFDNNKRQVIIGGGANEYRGKHYGAIINTIIPAGVPENYHWYDLDADKNDLSLYTKWTEKLTAHWQSFIDLQVRSVNYNINGFKDNPSLLINNDYVFFNPKAGITYIQKDLRAYLSYGRAAKEPNRNDFEAGVHAQPKAEILNDFEAGIENKNAVAGWGINLYYMKYKDQLVLTGQINDVGAYTRSNIPDSYRAGIELQGNATLAKWIGINGNIAFSRNKVKGFTEYIDDYDTDNQQTAFYSKPDIAFSPSIVSSANIRIVPLKNTSIDLTGKYVSKQYLDNTSNDNRSLNAYFTEDVRVSYAWKNKSIKALRLFAQVNNVFSEKYEPNGYTFSYISGGALATENYYFPMAPANIMVGLNISL